VSYLFNGNPNLIQGFNTFLPVGYRIDAQSKDFITVTTPTGTMTQTKTSGADTGGQGDLSWSVTGREGIIPTGDTGVLALGPGSIGVADTMVGIASTSTEVRSAPLPTSARVSGSPDPSMSGFGLDSQTMEPAVQYVHKIKQRCDPDTYKQFLEILSRYHQKSDTIDEVRHFILLLY
jgi:paired amphipathic helix protein Sin3a